MALDVYQQTERFGAGNVDNTLRVAEVDGSKFVYKGSHFEPVKSLLNDGETKMLLLDRHNPGQMFQFDLEKETVVSSYQSDLPLTTLMPEFQGAQREAHQVFVGQAPAAVFKLDTRVASAQQADKRSIRTNSLTYASNPHMSTAFTTSQGGIVTGSTETGIVRLFDGEANAEGKLKIAKNQIGGVTTRGLVPSMRGMKGVVASGDEQLLVVTMPRELLVMNLRDDGTTHGTGFRSRFKEKDRSTRMLTISAKTRREHNIPIAKEFVTATLVYKGDGVLAGIVSAVGNLLVVWDYRKCIRLRRPDACEVLKMDSNEDILAVHADPAEPGSVFVQQTQDVAKVQVYA